jgi:hypothetical protein
MDYHGKSGSVIMSTILITCSNMSDHVRAAQEKEGTDYPVIELDSKLHAEPRDMRARLFETLETLVGGRWDHQFIIAEKGRVLREEDFLR